MIFSLIILDNVKYYIKNNCTIIKEKKKKERILIIRIIIILTLIQMYTSHQYHCRI